MAQPPRKAARLMRRSAVQLVSRLLYAPRLLVEGSSGAEEFWGRELRTGEGVKQYVGCTWGGGGCTAAGDCPPPGASAALHARA